MVFDRCASMPSPAERAVLGDLLPLCELHPGSSGRIRRVLGSGDLRRRLIELGMLPGENVSIERTGPGGGPIWIRISGMQLGLRRAEAATILVDPVER